MIARALALAGACATGASAAWVPWAGPGGSRCALVTGADARTVLALAGAPPRRATITVCGVEAGLVGLAVVRGVPLPLAGTVGADGCLVLTVGPWRGAPSCPR